MSMTELRAAIVDDEPPARARLLRLLARLGGVSIVAEADSVSSGVAVVRAQQPQLLFLDIALGNGHGFQLLQRLPSPLPLVIFTTAFQQHAVQAFEVAAVDYLLKPFDAERLARSLQRVRERLRDDGEGDADERLRSLHAAMPSVPALERLIVRERGQRRVIAMDDVVRLSAAGNYVEISTEPRDAAPGQHLIRASLSRLIQRLDPGRWLRVHRSHVVRVDFIVSTTPCGHGDLTLGLRHGGELLLSRRYRKNLPRDLMF